MLEEPVQAVGDVKAAAVRVGGDPACGLARGWRALAGLVQGQSASQGCDGHLHALVVAEVSLAKEFLVKILGTVLALVPALLQVVEIGVQGGGTAGRTAHHLLPAAGAGVFAHGLAVQAELSGGGTVGPARIGEGVHGLEQPSGMPPGRRVRRSILNAQLGR